MLEQGEIRVSSPRGVLLYLLSQNGIFLFIFLFFRPVINFWRVNEVTNHYPLPVLKDLLMCLGGGNKSLENLEKLRRSVRQMHVGLKESTAHLFLIFE